MSQVTTCPHCHSRLRMPEGVTERTQICPHCLHSVENPLAGVQPATAGINTDVRRDLSAGTIVLAVLIGLCVIGASGCVIGASVAEGMPYGLRGLFCSLMLVLSFFVVLLSGRRELSVARVIGLAFLLSIITVVAFVIFFWVTCSYLKG
jgi:hypothetical protein